MVFGFSLPIFGFVFFGSPRVGAHFFQERGLLHQRDEFVVPARRQATRAVPERACAPGRVPAEEVVELVVGRDPGVKVLLRLIRGWGIGRGWEREAECGALAPHRVHDHHAA